MKTHIIIVIIIIVASALNGCTKENSDFKAILVPESHSSVITPDNMNTAAGIIRKRLNYSLGIPAERIKTDVTANQISLTVSKAETGKIASIKAALTDYAGLEFWETYENEEIIGYLSQANDFLKGLKRDGIIKNDSTADDFVAQNPLFAILKPRVTVQGEPLPSCMIGLASEKDTSLVNRYMKMQEIKALFPRELKLMWSLNPYKYEPSKNLYELHAIKVTTPDGKAPVNGGAIISARTIKGRSRSDVKIELSMNPEGTSAWARVTRENINRCIAVVLNGYVRSFPRVQAEISGGRTEITGDFTFEEANDLVSNLKSGQLPFRLKIIKEEIINGINSR